jgi:hypothetical protein
MFRRLHSPILMATAMALMFNLEIFYNIVERLEPSEAHQNLLPNLIMLFSSSNPFSR